MEISRNGLVYRVAYYFNDEAKRPVGSINGCNLFWQLIFSGLLYLLLMSTIFPMVLIVYTAALPLRWALGIFVGKKLVFHQKALVGNDWMDIVLNRLAPFNWKWVDIESWPRIAGWRILPFGVLVVSLLLGIFAGLVFINWHIGLAFYRGEYLPHLYLVLGELAVMAILLGGLLVSRMRKSTLWVLTSTNVKSFKDRTCPVVQVVD